MGNYWHKKDMKHKTYKQLYRQEDLVQNGQLRVFRQNHQLIDFIANNKMKEMFIRFVNVMQMP
jgi:hypothetical protein